MVHGMVRLRAVMWEGASLSAAQAWADSGGMCWCAGPVPGMSHLVALADRTTSRPLRHNLLRLLQVSTLLLTFSGSFSVIFSLFLSFLLLWVSLIFTVGLPLMCWSELCSWNIRPNRVAATAPVYGRGVCACRKLPNSRAIRASDDMLALPLVDIHLLRAQCYVGATS